MIGFVSVFLSECADFLIPLKWFLILGFILTIVDLRFGIAAAQKRGETIRMSRAGRRTINKIIDYFLWVVLAGCLGKAFGISFNIPILPAIILIGAYGFELNSIFENYYESRGKHVKVNIFKYFSKKADIIDIEDERENRTSSKGH